MNSPEVTSVLNRLMVLHNRSLPMYLGYAHPVLSRGEDAAGAVLKQIVEDQKRVVDRAGEMILELNGVITSGEFPMVYTAYNDISIDFLIPKMIAQQKHDIALIGRLSEMLNGHIRAKALADEALGAGKAHLESLEELLSPANA